jgi:hypothetical protein
MHVLYDNSFSKKVKQTDVYKNEKYAGKVQSPFQTGEFFVDTFHKVLFRFWNYSVKNTTSDKVCLFSHKNNLVSYTLGPRFCNLDSNTFDFVTQTTQL